MKLNELRNNEKEIKSVIRRTILLLSEQFPKLEWKPNAHSEETGEIFHGGWDAKYNGKQVFIVYEVQRVMQRLQPKNQWAEVEVLMYTDHYRQMLGINNQSGVHNPRTNVNWDVMSDVIANLLSPLAATGKVRAIYKGADLTIFVIN